MFLKHFIETFFYSAVGEQRASPTAGAHVD
jgi:hypothetical protein